MRAGAIMLKKCEVDKSSKKGDENGDENWDCNIPLKIDDHRAVLDNEIVDPPRRWGQIG